MNQSFYCPLPFNSLSLDGLSTPRVCCHETRDKKIPSVEINNAISLAHNKEIQEQFKLGKIPTTCTGCKKLEDVGAQSPRQEYLERFKDFKSYENKIEYLDLTIDNNCNLACLMCTPLYSYRLNTIFEQIDRKQVYPKWEVVLDDEFITTHLKNLKMLTITGGEPLISTNTKSLLERIPTLLPDNNINLRIFTNLTHLPKNLGNILAKFQSVELILSIDSIEENYELIRYPAKWSDLEKNLQILKKIEHPNLNLQLHSVIMATNWNKIGDLINYYAKLKLNSVNCLPHFLVIDRPVFLSPNVLPPSEINSGIEKILTALENIQVDSDIKKNEIRAFKNLIKQVEEKPTPNLYIEYQIYLKKIQKLRSQLEPS